MKKVTRCLAALITLVSLALAGCGKTTNPGANPSGAPGEKIAFENVYTETPLPIELAGVNYNGVKSAGGRVYFNGYKLAPQPEAEADEDEKNQSYQPTVQTLISCDLTGGDVKTHWEQEPEAQTNVDFEAPVTVHDYVNIAAFDADADGGVYIALSVSHSDYTDELNPIYENKFSLIKLAPDGTEVFNTDLSSKEGGELGDTWVQDILHDASGNVYLQSQEIHVYTPDGKHSFSVSEQSSSYIQAVTRANTGEVIYAVQEQTGTSWGYSFKPIDAAAKSAGTPMKYNGSHYFNGVYPGSGDYLFYYQYQAGLYGMDGATMTSKKIVDFINSDLAFDGNQYFAPIDGGGFVMAVVSYGGGMNGDTTTVSILTEDKTATLEGKTVLTLGALYSDTAAVTRFNKASRTTRIMVKDYSEYNTNDDYTKGQTQLDMDILSGRAPDIITLSGQTAKYTSKGVLADLTPLLESGKYGVARENLFENILTLGAKDGKIYQIMPTFNIMTLAGKASIFGDRASMTTAELAEIADKYPGATVLNQMTAPSWLNSAMWLGMDNYVDWAAGTCSFNSQEFIDMLNFSKRFPKEIDYNSIYSDQSSYLEYQREMENAYIEDRVLLYSEYIYSNAPRVARDLDVMFGEKTTLIGYPTVGSSGSIIMSNGGYAIAESSPNKDAAWEFICGLITYEEDSVSSMRTMNGISLDKRRFDAAAQAEMIPLEDRDFTNG
ncbi:MAG: extracellular solute-binding protein, partial [Oscillospiraceae bacterium]|nr:extracellular solute-binding protein [Oscillospiraceae bacterium]